MKKLLLLALLVVGCSLHSRFDVTEIEESGTINPIPIRVFEDRKIDDINITLSYTNNEKQNIEIIGKKLDYEYSILNKMQIPKEVINFDVDIAWIKRANLFGGFQSYLLNDSAEKTIYSGIGVMIFDWNEFGLRTDLFYTLKKIQYKAKIVKFEEKDTWTGDILNNEYSDSLLINKSYYENNLSYSMTINHYPSNLFINYYLSPGFGDQVSFSLDELDPESSLDYDNLTISRKQIPIWSIGFYKQIKKTTTVLGISYIEGNNDKLFKTFLQIGYKLNVN